MTFAETLLPRLASWRPAGEGRHDTTIALPQGWTVRLAAERVDTVGTLLHQVEAIRDVPVEEDAAQLEVHARRAAARVTGLLESLRVVEVDGTGHTALLRSDTPARKGETVSYYEVRLFGRNRVTVERYRATPSIPARREAVAFALTHEVLAKLIEDLIAA
jgi:hypothetical protein